MKPSFFNFEARINEKTFRLASRFLVAVMLACAAQTFVSLIQHIYGNWNPWYLTLAAFLVALVCVATYRRLHRFDLLGNEWLLHFGALWLLILAVLRLMLGLSYGLDAFLAELPRWAEDIQVAIPYEYYMVVLLAVSIWLLADYFTELLTKLDLDYVRLQRELPDALEAAQRPVRDRLLTLILNIGIVLVIFTALMRLDLRAAGNAEFVILELPPLAGGGVSTLLYFMLGLTLFSLTQFIDLQARWGLNKVPVSGDLAGRWVQYSLVFLVALTLLVAVLPTSYSLGFLAVIGYGLWFLVRVGFFLVQLFLTLVVLLINSIYALFNREPLLTGDTPLEPQFPEAFQPEALDPGLAAVTPPWVEILRQAFFWLVLLGFIAFAVRQVLLQNQDALDGLRRVPFLGFFIKLFGDLREFFKRAGAGVAEAFQSGMARLLPKGSPRQALAGWMSLRRLDPRNKVYFYYQAFLRRSGESGLPRSLSQTPAEFAKRLDSALPEAEPDIEALTGAFIEARYTRKEIESQSASFAQHTWERIRKALRSHHGENSGG